MLEALWAKKEEKDGLMCWLPLTVHLEDTGRIMGLLWEHWMSEGQKRTIADDTDIGKQIAIFIGAIHDIGKASPAFQLKKGFANSKDLDKELTEKLVRAGFIDIDSPDLLSSPEKTPHGLAGEVILSVLSDRFKKENDIGSIVGGHHGRPIDNKSMISEVLSSYKKNLFQSENEDSDIYKKWVSVHTEILNNALKSSSFKRCENIPVLSQPAQAMLLGLLTMADWIASNTYFFPLIGIFDDADIDMNKRCEYGFKKWKKSNGSDMWLPEVYADCKNLFKERFGFEPRDVQSKFAQTISDAKNPGLVILEAPMGLGKTEAALVGAEELAAKSGRSGLFFGLPTQATSNGIFPRIISWLKSQSVELGEKRGLRLVHGKAFLNEEYNNLTSASNIDIDGDNEGREGFVVNQWFCGKKTAIMDDFVVGTVDQLLMMALRQKHLALRHLGLSKKVVVIDEVHAYDAYMDQYLNMALEWLGAYNVPVILLSATLPKKSRVDFIKYYLKGKGVKFSKEDMSSLMVENYPLITYTDNDKALNVKHFAPIEDKRIEIKYTSTENLHKLLDSLLDGGGNAGVIVNTVKKAQDIAKELSEKFGDENVMLLHSSFIATDRVKNEEKLMKYLGRDGDRPQKLIVVGTQVIEQSLDIDFDVMISDIAPVDLLIQRMGRLHRHTRDNRPRKHKKPVLYVLGNDKNLEFETGSKAVYGGYLLARTGYFLGDSIRLPSDISRLVQEVYDENIEPDLSDELKKKYYEYKVEYEALVNSKESRAGTYRLSSPVLKKRISKEPSLIGWLNNQSRNFGEEEGNSQVRDTQDTIEVIALKKIKGGYTTFDSDEDMSENIEDTKIAKRIASCTIKLPNKLLKSYNIDKTIRELEDFYINNLQKWDNSAWLKGTLCAMFDENNECSINGVNMIYDKKYGLISKGENDAKV
ncbi:CRISPR-associated helicase/endonuclease Cas3 [Lachnoanaerobaculum sp. OBRC5-5]|uniref:CRISPR-associated helicase/endonuclease Cas3 n=1 Tax=Lachnoanaerobaculum sp. OBRC5-5 TaxID=936595 RepID=UPI0002824A92|nr:CRISPR-associated helicase/endonuclease Cas3 [Lachnoanaerobaculum sp. OBRC5-5]EJZ69664.1 CRISPR-associated helicase cas3 [Lachnoanaerobaculum sp. OBRC5-5]